MAELSEVAVYCGGLMGEICLLRLGRSGAPSRWINLWESLSRFCILFRLVVFQIEFFLQPWYQGRCLIAMLDAEQRDAEQHEQRGLLGKVPASLMYSHRSGLRHADLALRPCIPDNLLVRTERSWSRVRGLSCFGIIRGWTSVSLIQTQYYPGALLVEDVDYSAAQSPGAVFDQM
eukprot:g71662.t1